MFVRWKRTTIAKRSLETNVNKLITAIWEIQKKWWSVSLNSGKAFGKNELLKIWNFTMTNQTNKEEPN